MALCMTVPVPPLRWESTVSSGNQRVLVPNSWAQPNDDWHADIGSIYIFIICTLLNTTSDIKNELILHGILQIKEIVKMPRRHREDVIGALIRMKADSLLVKFLNRILRFMMNHDGIVLSRKNEIGCVQIVDVFYAHESLKLGLANRFKMSPILGPLIYTSFI